MKKPASTCSQATVPPFGMEGCAGTDWYDIVDSRGAPSGGSTAVLLVGVRCMGSASLSCVDILADSDTVFFS